MYSNNKLLRSCSVLQPFSIRGLATHHGRTFSIHLCPLSFWLTLPRGVLSTYWCVSLFAGNMQAIRCLAVLIAQLPAVVKVDRRIRWHYTTTVLRLRIGARLTRYRNCNFHNGCRTISRPTFTPGYQLQTDGHGAVIRLGVGLPSQQGVARRRVKRCCCPTTSHKSIGNFRYAGKITG